MYTRCVEGGGIAGGIYVCVGENRAADCFVLAGWQRTSDGSIQMSNKDCSVQQQRDSRRVERL